MNAHSGRLVKKLEVNLVEKGICELGTAYQRAVERGLDFGHGWMNGPL